MTSRPTAEGHLPQWLRITLRHLAVGLRRGELRRGMRERAVARELEDRSRDPASIAEQAELSRHVVAAVQGLEEPFRTAVVLRFWRGLLPEAIAVQLGVPRNTVRSRLQRSLARLRERLDAEYGARVNFVQNGLPVDSEGRLHFASCVPGPHQLFVLDDALTQLLQQAISIVPGPNSELVIRLPAK
ncbi:MAG: sigma-70 family RNA polymerase sigma factor [Planctomycetota bacterium]